MDDTKKLLAALGYPIPIIGLVMAIVEKEDQEARLHAWQGFLFWVGAFIVQIAAVIVAVIFDLIPVIGGVISFIVGLLGSLVWLAWIVMAIIFAVKVYQGSPVIIPIVTPQAQKIVSKPAAPQQPAAPKQPAR
ncbi:hypothetical protein GF351_01140 [Candidatus Woesearchaeota archaeon]|nr:hypothetical protein [Candidatus Woesearchaeota archaeon]